MIGWLVDTLLYTGALIALVLVLRGPVARQFGPQMSYALWALPFLRFIMPPVVLPASFAPAPAADQLVTSAGSGVLAPLSEVAFHPASAAQMPDFFPPAVPTIRDTLSGMVADALVLAWLGGAAAFLLWRWWTYYRMRDWLLAGARPVGEVGRIRLVESPAAISPVAFGVSDKVIALPMEFMAMEDRAARDLAIEHELAHHRGLDLLANILAQPLLALHWFNPLAWLGWRAMRRDQEAACDARVIARYDPRVRAQYGRVIASFAAGPRLSLAAPMAGHRSFGPLLGEKSIIHRLRSLTMADISPRRRLAGRLMLAGAVIALPLTASVSYAEQGRAEQRSRLPEPPAPPAPPMAPAAPYAPVAPDAPLPPEPPVPPVPSVSAVSIVETGVVQQDGASRKAASDLDRQSRQWETQWEDWGKQLEVNIARIVSTSISTAVSQTAMANGCGMATSRSNGASAQAAGDCDMIAAKMGEKAAANANASARAALLEVRASIARNRDLDAETRREVLQELDQEIRELATES
ncbi:antirepressor regulating drug resistance protein [Altererythrobacter sp. CC-YST694]|uniref:M56 family metallopeptidase n=1 Tax=Altererythrobacter sp. CC-YST694 TaxID=2755038 RepID=UPI001D01D42B|nr:M56 family metallopeptidase [Altererythrobacter sp. CC-YST694]MCB5424313.1 antirepressor regulating drug resistance protein [Altererythrobacter sp. CC-YST694]